MMWQYKMISCHIRLCQCGNTIVKALEGVLPSEDPALIKYIIDKNYV